MKRATKKSTKPAPQVLFHTAGYTSRGWGMVTLALPMPKGMNQFDEAMKLYSAGRQKAPVPMSELLTMSQRDFVAICNLCTAEQLGLLCDFLDNSGQEKANLRQGIAAEMILKKEAEALK